MILLIHPTTGDVQSNKPSDARRSTLFRYLIRDGYRPIGPRAGAIAKTILASATIIAFSMTTVQADERVIHNPYDGMPRATINTETGEIDDYYTGMPISQLGSDGSISTYYTGVITDQLGQGGAIVNPYDGMPTGQIGGVDDPDR